MPRPRPVQMSWRAIGMLLAAEAGLALLAACAGDVVSLTPAPLTPVVQRLPAPATSAPPQMPSTPARTPMPPATTTVPPTPSIPVAAHGLTADNVRRLHELRAIGEGGASALALAPDGTFLAIGTTAGWGL